MKKHYPWLAGGLLALLASLVYLVPAWTNDPPRSGEPPAAKDEAPAKGADSRIVHVTVYPDSALVTREVDVPAGAGSLELVVSPLPEHTINSSLYSEGGDGIRVLTTRFRTRPIQESAQEDVRKLEDEARKLTNEAQKLQADMEACKQNMALLAKLEGFTTVSTQNATEKGKLDSDATIQLAKYLMDGRGERTKEMVTLQQQLQTNQEQQQFVQRKLNKLRERSAGKSQTECDAVIVVEKANAAAGKVRLNYLVDAASWRPQYKLRAGQKAGDKVQVEYLAAIMQQTGEDWRNVGLVLSTAQPRLNAAPPELKMLSVAVVPRNNAPRDNAFARLPKQQQPAMGGQGGGMMGMGTQQQKPMEQGARNKLAENLGVIPNPEGLTNMDDLASSARALRQEAQQALNDRQVDAGNTFWNYAGALDQARDLVLNPEGKTASTSLARAGRDEGPSVTYHLKAQLSVPSRNDEQVIEVARLDMEPEWFYKAVPVLTPHVYRQANLVNKSKYVLLPGEATMYDGSDFVGRMQMPLVAIGEQMTVGFGVEPQLQVQRQMMDKTRTMQGGNQVLRYEYRILVQSYKGEKAKLQVWDRLPQAENETMGVSLVKATPEVSKDALYLREEKPRNLLRWDLEVDPASNGEKAQTIRYEFKLELDKQMTFGSFQSK
jgi:hypothetical protein